VKTIDYGVTPVENSTQGTVTETVDLLLDSPTIKICGEIEVKVHQNLIVNPGAKEKDVNVARRGEGRQRRPPPPRLAPTSQGQDVQRSVLLVRERSPGGLYIPTGERNRC
jgi:hypothetical protein